MRFETTDKRIVLTGGTSGIGLELVKILAPQASLIVVGRDTQKLDKLKAEFPGIETIIANLAERASVETAAKEITSKCGAIDVLINNAAIQYEPHFISAEFDPEMIRQEMDVNFTNVCYLIHGLLPSLRKDTPSAILNIGSGLGLAAKPASAIYCASKGALNIFSQSLRYQLDDTNISVLQALLPMVATPMTEGRGSGKISADEAADKIVQGLHSLTPDNDIGKVKLLRRMLRIAPSVAYRIMRKAG
ncbi:MAG: SDR family NAD(P)-dependent oxidoreductase [Kordiimonadaceae bacterium]|nr:SDR family NAD(P)-dependent oxidoreductase [Kordiimonadaceae bacterium]MBO6570233.1 SDR family NAD(P)-dependent oxidoreductase [Kordiimonadaceae bacterium]MBO6965669.1 SDR family NAD(P)-dependent oxidoreductase [Kordiimonadaceae bacterium]